MSQENNPTLRERAIATNVNNQAGFKDLIVDIADAIDKLTITESPEREADETATASPSEESE